MYGALVDLMFLQVHMHCCTAGMQLTVLAFYAVRLCSAYPSVASLWSVPVSLVHQDALVGHIAKF